MVHSLTHPHSTFLTHPLAPLNIQDCPFVVRGPTYLKDRKKIPAGLTAFTLAAMDVVTMPHPVEHVSRFLPCVRCVEGGM